MSGKRTLAAPTESFKLGAGVSMSPFEYALGLISILMSLALTDVVMSFHRLLRRRDTVKWDGRVLVAAALVILEVIRIWFAQRTLRDAEVALGFPVYLFLFTHILLLVLTAAACLAGRGGGGLRPFRLLREEQALFLERLRRHTGGLFLRLVHFRRHPIDRWRPGRRD